MKKRLFSLMLAMTLVMGSATTVAADEEDDIRAAQAQAASQLDNTYSQLDSLSQQQAAVQAQISSVNADLVDLMVQISQAESDIEFTKSMIATTQADIETTQAELAEQKDLKARQYADMVNRIQYIYENGGIAGWTTIMLKVSDLSSFLNRAEYTTQLENADRAALKAYEDTITLISEEERQLEEQKADLEYQQAMLEAQEEELQVQKAELERQLQAAEAANADYANQISAAREQAAQIEALMAQQQAELDRIEAEKAEAARRAAEEAAAREAAARAQAEAAAKEAASAGSSDAPVSSGGSGEDIVEFACRWLGNPYVWGGNSLTNGIDCSHFVWQVLRATGHYSGGYMTSGYWAGAGQRVGSLAEARAGDIIVYSGHVAIYDGNGMIVEAKGSAWGITHDRAADCKRIIAIRRFT
ncbi:MAG: NlpC/P60 family protein [Lachnospiraceae bacterium]|nr:NlpC/P60 family protein [Lachnospiraceae bacterium]